MPLRINVVTIFPDFFAGPLGLSIPARAKASGGVEYNIVDLRDYTHDKHKTVDDAPYGGGAGMVMKPGPFFEAAEAIGAKSPIVLLSPRGKQFGHADAVRFAEGEELTLLCGHYKDVDQRVADHLCDGELSVGELLPRVGLSQSALSQHLAVLREEGVVATRREGQSIWYRIDDPAAVRVVATLAEIFCPPDMRNGHDHPSDPPGAR